MTQHLIPAGSSCSLILCLCILPFYLCISAIEAAACGPCKKGSKKKKRDKARSARVYEIGYEIGYPFLPPSSKPWPQPFSLEGRNDLELSIPLHGPSTHAALNSSNRLLNLPMEIRLAIFDHVLGKKDMHVAKSLELPSDKTVVLEVVACEDKAVKVRGQICHCCTARFTGYKSKYPDSAINVLGLLLTCRSFYTTITTTLTKYRTWQTHDLDSTIMASLCLPQHFRAITSLHFNAKHVRPGTTFTSTIVHLPSTYHAHFSHLANQSPEIGFDPKTHIASHVSAWLAVCDILSKMQSLRKLNIELCHTAFANTLYVSNESGLPNESNMPQSNIPQRRIYNETFVFAPLVHVGTTCLTLQSFEVAVDWPPGQEGWDGREKLFVLRRVGDLSMRDWMRSTGRWYESEESFHGID